MIWFVIGAALGCLQFAFSLWRRPTEGEHPFQAFAVSAVLGAAIYGTILWLVVTYVF